MRPLSFWSFGCVSRHSATVIPSAVTRVGVISVRFLSFQAKEFKTIVCESFRSSQTGSSEFESLFMSSHFWQNRIRTRFFWATTKKTLSQNRSKLKPVVKFFLFLRVKKRKRSNEAKKLLTNCQKGGSGGLGGAWEGLWRGLASQVTMDSLLGQVISIL